MVIRKFIILSLLITQVLSAPSGCIESCGSYVKHFGTESSDIQNHGVSTETAAQLQGLDYSRPGSWTEHNDYNVNNGHGKVHEEKGQIIDGAKTVRYYKKNYSSSYGTKYPSGTGSSEIEQLSNNYRQGVHIPNPEDVFNSQRLYDQVRNSESISQQNAYNRIQSQQHQQHTQSSVRRTNTQNERLEDFGEYNGNSQVVQQGVSDYNTQLSQQPSSTSTQTGNWSKVDSYKTDGGHGRVFEEEGQYMSGPKKVRYYRRNYTSSYGSTNRPPIFPSTKVRDDDLYREIENIHREASRGSNQVSTTRDMTTSNIEQTNINTSGDLHSDNLHGINSNVYRGRTDGNNLLTVHHDEQQHHTDTGMEYSPYRTPSPNTHGANSYSMYERHEGYVRKVQPSRQYINPTSGYTDVLSTGNSGYNRNMYTEGSSMQHTDKLHQMEQLNTQQSRLVQNQMTDDTLRQSVYNHDRLISSGIPSQASHYKEQWSSSHAKEATVPHYTSGISQINEHSEQYNNRYRESNFNAGHQTKFGKLMTGAIDLGQVGNAADCTYGTAEHTHTSSQYHTMHKRNAKYHELSDTQQTEQLTQKTGEFDNLPQQTSGKLEFGQQAEDLTQQTGEFDDLTQQTSGKLEFGQQSQHSNQPWVSGGASQHSEDLTQQTSDMDDLTQQTSGKLEFGQQSQHSHQPWRPGSASQHSADLTPQTGEFDDLTQQTSGKLEFGQQSQHSHQPWRPGSSSHHSADLTPQTGEFDDLTQQTSGKLEFGQQSQHSHQPWRPGSASHHSADLTQQTGEFDDLTQQTSGKLEFGQQSQHSHQPWRPGSASHHSADLTQQTGEFDDLTQQTSGKLEFGQQSQHSHKPWREGSASQHSIDLTPQTGEFDDLTQQTSGKLEFGQQSQHSHQPWRPGSASLHSEDLTQQTGKLNDLTQQTYWKPSSHSQQSADLTQQTSDMDDLTQQTSGKLEFGQKTEDLTQQTGEFDGLTQQTSGKLEFGQQSQHSHQPWRSGSASLHLEDLTQQTGEFDDLTQQTSGNLEFGQQSQHSYQSWKPNSASQHSADLTQQTSDMDDLTQQTSGKLEFGQQSQHSYEPWKPSSASQHSEHLTQQTSDMNDLTQQFSGKLELGQFSHEPWRPDQSSQQLKDLPQQTNSNEHNSQMSNANEDKPAGEMPSTLFTKPAGKPKPRSRYSRVGSVSNLLAQNQNVYNSNDQHTTYSNSENTSIGKVHELPPKVVPEAETENVRSQNSKADQSVGKSMDKDKSVYQQTQGNVFDSEGGNMDQGNWLHKSNDATVGLHWHYTYHPSDQRPFVQQTDRKDKEDLQQQSSNPDLYHSEDSMDQQETQNKYTSNDSYQQSSNPGNEKSGPYQQSQNYQETDNVHKESQLEFGQQTLSKNENVQNHVKNNESNLQLESRILEVYGGGPYDATHDDNIYNGVTANPSVTLPPLNSDDPWDIREKPREMILTPYEVTPPPMAVVPLSPDKNDTMPPSSLWSRIGNKITNTIGKAKEKARNIFG
ncbi:hypothetical protein WN55_01555 [Dufourea novaeangliae]|uniref:Uncharacterized protein n=1 Tax=Dufourea novaeangliae TaxID=178035 RepID=A0A154PG52_DUFNO|nr:hypothetical protein WN55_01555 [Dufourea novaeangliae]